MSRPIKLSRRHPRGSVIDLDNLLEKRLLIQGGSGSGKSFIARVLLERATRLVQQIIIDPEGEYSTLRKVGDYLHCGADGDLKADVKSAYTLGKRIRRTRVSAIVDVYEFKGPAKRDFVRRFLEGVMDAPKKDWHECLLFIDESHLFAPQSQSSVALDAVIDVAGRGRKRGIGLICATHRLAKLHKDVVAELYNRLIGQTGLKLDIRGCAEEMGVTPQDARELLVKLKPGEFWSFGPGIGPEYECFRADLPKTRPPKAGSPELKRSVAVEKVLASLRDLEREAQEEVRTLEDLRKQNRELRARIRALEKSRGTPPADVKQKIADAVAAVPKIDRRAGAAVRKKLTTVQKLLDYAAQSNADALESVATLTADVDGLLAATTAPRPPGSNPPPPTNGKKPPAPKPPPPANHYQPESGTERVTKSQQRILNALAWMNALGVDRPNFVPVAVVAKYKPKGGRFSNVRGELRNKGLIDVPGDGTISLTEAGHDLAEHPDVEPTNDAMHAAALSLLTESQRRLMRPVLDRYPEWIHSTDLAVAARYQPGAGRFNNLRGELRSLTFIEMDGAGNVRASAYLFPEDD